MNQKTATIINFVARITKQASIILKRQWYLSNAKERTHLRRGYKIMIAAHRKKLREDINNTNALVAGSQN
jgi:hypothetical protein